MASSCGMGGLDGYQGKLLQENGCKALWEKAAQGKVELPSLEVLKRCVDVALGDVGWWWLGHTGLIVGLDDIKGIFQPELFYDFLSSRVYSATLRADAISKDHL